ncbi:MAG TPA: biliverdin-producing heme oxygenase [Candidatus Angelobacter sp.]|nr:biliverdin-producing heme oxygenase [Candidatus Angelobacter sp.]
MSLNTSGVHHISAQDDILARVKRETRQSHERLESIMPLGRETFSREQYVGVLKKFYGMYKPLEAELSRVADLPNDLDLAQRRKMSLIENDLRTLGFNDEQLQELPEFSAARHLSVPEALGAMYVMEGATLGGQFISRMVALQLGLDRKTGCAFFTSYGAEVGERWHKFGEVVRKRVVSQDDQDRFVTAATKTFTDFERWVGKQDHD